MEFQTSRLYIKPLTIADRERLLDLLTDETIGKTYMLPVYTSRAEAEPLMQRLIALSREPARFVSGIYRNGQLIGILNETERKDSQIEMGYALLPDHYNRGYATETLRGAIEYLFAEGFEKVICGAFAENAPSIRVMEKSGMEKQPETDWIDYRGKAHCCVYYARSK